MDTKLQATRAVFSLLALRVVRFWTIIVFLILGLIFLGCWALAYYVSPWWWILLVAYIPILFICIIVRLFIGFLVNKLYITKALSRPQRKAVNSFADKLQRLAEAQGIGWPMFAFISFKDLLFYRDLRTVRHTIEDGTSLRRDFEELEKLF